jgi:hypothetical protein
MAKQFKWTNRSVVDFANGNPPVEVMEGRARELALKARE